MREDLDLIKHSNNLITIKDLNDDLNISNSKWDFVFDYLLKENSVVYFQGFRLWVKEDDLLETMLTLTDTILLNKDNYFIVLFKVKLGFIVLNRGLLNKMWEYYEYPSLIFLKDDKQESKLMDICTLLPSVKERIAESLKNIFIARRGGEPDVLWLEKSSDLKFPWETIRSPRAIERGASKSWYEKLLNKMGFYWDIKINRKEE